MRIGLAFTLIIAIAGTDDVRAQTTGRRPQRTRRSQPAAEQPRGATGAFPDLAKVTAPVDPADIRAATWKLAGLMSFPYYPANGNTPQPPTERLYLPLRGKQLTLDPRLGYEHAAGAILAQFDRLTTAPDAEIAKAVKGARSIYLERFKIGAVNQVFGNTPDASFAQFGAYLKRGMDKLKDLEDQLERDKEKAGRENAPLSSDSREKLGELMKAMAEDANDNGGIHDFLKKPAEVSGVLAYADMAAVDRLADYWDGELLPLVKHQPRKEADKQLVEIGGFWRPKGGRERFSRLDHFSIKNVSKERLGHVVVKVLAENKWGEKAAHYYYFPSLAVGESFRLLAHPRWEKRRLDFTNSIDLMYSVWADSGSDDGRTATLTNPEPNPDPEGWRKDYLRFDSEFASRGEKLGLFVRLTYPEPVTGKR